ncbi:hypothetical protein WICPIJ_009428 [Wickerhamomyces pijperi]|uniref:Uncharacterized protein n=1 Tax=Wickerhamomyces pijperi TaxID=599730 RepID=A0A9P8PP25_WICPI|nr:hypothetical protein WICPIJ_009428 [Wickerhamomyces pijperi]
MSQSREQIVGHRREDIEQGLSVTGEVRERFVRLIGNIERILLENNVQQHNPNGPNITFRRVVSLNVSLIEQLRSHVPFAAHGEIVTVSLGGGKPPIGQSDGPVCGDQHVLRLDVSMVDSFVMGILHRFDQLHGDVDDISCGLRPSV